MVLRLVGEIDEVEIQTRWKERDGVPTLVEASHLRQAARDDVDAAEGAGAEAEPIAG